MTVALEGPDGMDRVRGTGVVVASEGDRHRGYAVSVLFLSLAPAAHGHDRAVDRASLS